MSFRFCWVVLSVLFLLSRFANTPGVLTNAGVVFPDTDTYYRMHRISTMVHGDLTYPLHDNHLQSPKGFDVPWPLGLDLLLALPLKVLNVQKQVAIESFSAVTIPFLALPCLWLVGSIGLILGGPLVSILSGVLLLLSVPNYQATQIGQIDHHLFETLFTLLALWLFVQRFFLKKKNNLLWILFFTLTPSFWSNAWALSFSVSLGFLAWNQTDEMKSMAKIFLFGSLLTLIPLSFSDRLLSLNFSPFSFSCWTPMIYLFCSAFLFLRSQRTYKHLFLGFCLLVPPLLFFIFRSQFLNLWYGVNAKYGISTITYETHGGINNLLKEPMKYLSLLTALPLSVFLLTRQTYRPILAFSSFLLLLPLIQLRFFVHASGLLSLMIPLGLFEISKKYILDSRLKYGLPILVSLTVGFLYPTPFHLTSYQNRNPFFIPILDLSEFIQKRESPEKGAIIAPWNYGHWLLYGTGLPVVADPFQGPNGLEVYQLLLSTEKGALERFGQSHPAKYLIIETPTNRIQKWLKALGREEEYKTYPIKNALLYRFFYGQPDPGWKLVYESPTLKLFERL